MQMEQHIEIHGEEQLYEIGASTWVIGDSLLRGVESTMPANLNVDVEKVTITVDFHSGSTLLTQLELLELRLASTSTLPDCVIFHMGTNDLCRGRVEETLRQWRRATRAVRDKFPSVRVVFCSILPRLKAHYRMKVSMEEFGNARQLANQFLENIGLHDVHFWSHEHKRFRKPSTFGNDGIHLSERGKNAMARSIRGAVLKFTPGC